MGQLIKVIKHSMSSSSILLASYKEVRNNTIILKMKK